MRHGAIYNVFSHSIFLVGMQSDMAVEIFKNMKSCGFAPNAVTYNIMIDCCSILKCFKSACSLVSMMVRDGFYPQTLTYTALIKVFLCIPWSCCMLLEVCSLHIQRWNLGGL